MASTFARLVWFTLVGWWFGILWVLSALIIMCTLIGFPLGVYMLLKTKEVVLLESNPKAVVVEAKAESSTD